MPKAKKKNPPKYFYLDNIFVFRMVMEQLLLKGRWWECGNTLRGKEEQFNIAGLTKKSDKQKPTQTNGSRLQIPPK